MPSTHQLYRTVTALPAGRFLFSQLYRRKAPYFNSAKLSVTAMEKHRGEVIVPKKRGTLNHIGTVHAIAACNGLEAAMGLLAEATCPPDHRWLPQGMDVEYLAKSESDLVCTATTTEADWAQAPNVPVTVTAVRDDGTVTVRGTIRLWVTPKK